MAKVSNASRAGFIRTLQAATKKKALTPTQQIARSIIPDANYFIAEKCRRDFAYFIREFWPEVSADELSWNWHIDTLAKELMEIARKVGANEPRDNDLIINIPPGTTKSITCSIMFPVWCWTNWPWMRFIASSYSMQLALEHAEASRDMVRSQRFRELFPDIDIKRDKDTKSNFRLVYQKDGEAVRGGNRLSTSVGGTLTGFHAHILIVDDPLDPNRSVSPVELKRCNRWMDQTLSTRKVNKALTPTILIMQRLHQNDPTGHILAKQRPLKRKTVKLISIPGEIREFREFVQPPELVANYIDDLLDPKRMNWKVMDDMKSTLGQYGYAGQVGQHPVPPGGGMFKSEKFGYILPAQVDPRQFDSVVRYWDKAGTADGGAYTVGIKMARLKEQRGVIKFVVLDVKRGQWSSEKREAIIRSTAEADGVSTIIWHEQEPGSGGKESAESTISNLSGFTSYADRPTGDKVHRADPYSVQVNNGNVMLVQADWNTSYIEECRYFPFGTYKDQVDGSSGAFNKLNAGRKGWVL